MRSAQQVVVRRFGDPDVLTLIDVNPKEPGLGQVLVRVEAAGVLYGDVMRRTDRYLLPTPLPYAPGTEIAGTVVAVGKEVHAAVVGDRIVAFVGSGGYSHYAVVDANALTPLPEDIGFSEATALLAQGVTAYLLTHDVANLRGRTVFIESAAGGVGSQMAQLARSQGATFIAGTASSETKRAFARSNGVDLVIDSRAEHWSAQVLEATAGRGIDVGYESSGSSFGELLKCLAPFGTLVKFGRGVEERRNFDPTVLLEANQSLRGFYLPGYREPSHVALLGAATRSLIDLNLSGALKIHIDHRYTLAEAALAHRTIEARRTMGKVVIEPWRDSPG